MFSFTPEDVLMYFQAIEWSQLAAFGRPVVSGLSGLIGGWIAARLIARKERKKRGSGFWYDRVTIARYMMLPDGSWFKTSIGGLNLTSLFKSELNANDIINKTGPNGMDRNSPLYQHVRDILFQEASERLDRSSAKGIHGLTFRKNDRGDGSRGNLEVVLTPVYLWNLLKANEELPEVVVGKNHLEAMQECAKSGAPDWFIACQPEGAEEFRKQGLGMMKTEDAPS